MSNLKLINKSIQIDNDMNNQMKTILDKDNILSNEHITLYVYNITV